MSKTQIKCTRCNVELTQPKKGLLDSRCDCGNVTVVWNVFSDPVEPIHVRALDSRGFLMKEIKND